MGGFSFSCLQEKPVGHFLILIIMWKRFLSMSLMGFLLVPPSSLYFDKFASLLSLFLLFNRAENT